MRLRLFASTFFAALCGAACGHAGSEPGAGPTAPASGSSCLPESGCSECGRCFDACLCGGGAIKRCAEECGTDGEPADAAPGSLVATLEMESFEIPAGQEYVRCQRFANPFGRDVVLTRTESFMTAGSHHLFVFLSEDAEPGPLEVCSGLEFAEYLHTSQRPHEIYDYPSGVGRLLRADRGVKLQIHYLNPLRESTRVELAVTLRAAEPEQVSIRAGQIFINTAFINVPPHSGRAASTRCSVPKDVELFSAISHMHQYGLSFGARDSTGQLLYATNDWEHPEPWNFAPPRRILAGSTIEIRCDYQNTSDATLTFGESAATNEMCIFAGGYYPAIDGEEVISCLL